MNKFLNMLAVIFFGALSFSSMSHADTMVMTPTKETQKEIENKTEKAVQKEIEKQVKEQNLVVVPKDAVKETVPEVIEKPEVKEEIKEEEKYMVRDAITGKMVEQKQPFKETKPKESLRDQIRKKFDE